MGMMKIPQRMSWEKFTWQKKKKKKNKISEMTVSKDNKKGNSLVAQIKR